MTASIAFPKDRVKACIFQDCSWMGQVGQKATILWWNQSPKNSFAPFPFFTSQERRNNCAGSISRMDPMDLMGHTWVHCISILCELIDISSAWYLYHLALLLAQEPGKLLRRLTGYFVEQRWHARLIINDFMSFKKTFNRAATTVVASSSTGKHSMAVTVACGVTCDIRHLYMAWWFNRNLKLILNSKILIN